MGELIFETTQALFNILFIVKIRFTLLLLVQNMILDLSDFFSELHVLEVYYSMNDFMLFVRLYGFPLILENVNDLQELVLVVLHLVNDLSFL